MSPYPYNVLPAMCPSEKDAEILDPWFILEFFRVEALLRSKRVMKLYAQDMEAGCLGHLDNTSYFTEPYWALTREDARNDSLHKQYKVAGGWLVLKGMHHKYLSPEHTATLFGQRGRPIQSEAVQNITEDLLSGLKLGTVQYEVTLDLVTRLLNNEVQHDKGKRILWLRVDAAFPPQTIINLLRPKLAAMHEALASVSWEQIGPAIFHPRHRPLIQGHIGMKKWFDCLTAYDMKVLGGHSYRKIAQQIYGKSTITDYERAEKSFKRFKQLIAAAESDNWPPKGIK